MATCLMLDVDGVLVDGRPGDGRRWTHDLQKDLGVSAKALARHFFAPHWGEIVIGRKPLLPTLAAVLDHIAPGLRAETFVDYWFEKDSRILGPVLSELRAARRAGIAVYLATNQEHMRAHYLMTTMGLGDEVEGLIYSAAAGSRKPQPGFFRHAQRRAGLPPQALLLVDDTLANVEAARAAGWEAAHWDGSEGLRSILERHFPG